MPSSQQDPNIFIAAFLAGDAKAFAFFFHLHYRPLRVFAHKLLRNWDEAADIVEDVFLKLWLKHRDFNTPENIKAFLYIATRNGSINILRYRRNKEPLNDEMHNRLRVDVEDIALTRLMRAETTVHIHSELNHLSPKGRQIIKLAYLDGLSNLDIARQLNISIHTVKEHKQRALSFLRSSDRLLSIRLP